MNAHWGRINPGGARGFSGFWSRSQQALVQLSVIDKASDERFLQERKSHTRIHSHKSKASLRRKSCGRPVIGEMRYSIQGFESKDWHLVIICRHLCWLSNCNMDVGRYQRRSFPTHTLGTQFRTSRWAKIVWEWATWALVAGNWPPAWF